MVQNNNLKTALMAILVLVLGFSIYASFFFYKKSKNFYAELDQTRKNLMAVKYDNKKLLNYEKMAYEVEVLWQYLDKFEMLNEHGGLVEIDKATLSPSDTLIFFFYSYLNCNSCINAVFGEIDWIESADKLYLMADYEVKRDLINFKKRSKINQEVYKNKNGTLSRYYETFPFFIAMMGSYTSAFFPEKEYPERTIDFLSRWNLN